MLQPWYDVDPGAVIPGEGPVAELLEKVDVSGLTLREDLTFDVQ